MADIRPTARELYLARVAAALRLPRDLTAEVTEELATHIADATSDLQAEGLDPDRAEREALARLGNPDELAGGVRRAHQTRRRLLAAAGGGIFAGIRGLAIGYFVAGGLLALASALAMILASIVMSTLQLTTSSYNIGWVGGPIALFAVGYAGHRVPAIVAVRSHRRVEDVRLVVGLAGAVPVAVIALLLIRLPLDLWTVAAMASAPAAFVVGAATAGDRPTLRIPIRAFLAVLVVATAVVLLGYVVTGRWNPVGGGMDEPAPTPDLGLADTIDLPLAIAPTSSGFGAFPVMAEVGWDDPAALAAWSDIRLEAWRVTDEEAWTPLDPAPFLILPATVEDTYATVTTDLPPVTERTWFVLVLTGIGPDDRRYRLADDAPRRVEFVGTGWDWLTTR